MSRTGTITERDQSAVRFFWTWLILATTASVAGNVAHAWFNTGAANTVVAAIASVVPPAVLLGATHGVALMVRTQIAGRTFRVAIALLVALALCALVLSFHSLHELVVVQGGMPSSIAWLWPLSIDLSIAFSTIALLALTTGTRARRQASKRVTPAQSVTMKAAA